MELQTNPRRTRIGKTRGWNTFFVDPQSIALATASNAQIQQNDIYKRYESSMEPKDQAKVQQLSDEVMKLYDKATDETELLDKQQDAEFGVGSLEDLVGKFLPEAEASQNSLAVRRRTGHKKISSSLQTFATNFAGFLYCYSDMFGILQTVDNQFGGVAIQTLSLLLVVAVNKKRTEDEIDSALANIRNQFPRLKELRGIYPTPKMEQLVANVYAYVLEFANSAIEYYRRSGWIRMWQAISSPPQIGVAQIAARILAELAEVKEERDTLLNKRVLDIQRSVERLDSRVTDVQLDVQNIRNQKDQELLNELRPGLLPDDFSHVQHLKDYRSQLQGAFDRPRRLHQVRLAELQERHEFSAWLESERTTLLLIGGQTKAELTPLCWLSPIAEQLIDFLYSRGEIAAYHFCKLATYMEEDVSMHTVLSRIVYQLLSQHPQLLRKTARREDIMRKTSTERWTNKVTKSVCELLVDLLGEFGPVFLILDRLDCCKMGFSGLEMLLEMMQRAACTARILVIMETPDRADILNLESSALPGSIATILEWDQVKERN